jgi:hypothetical protein
VEEEESEHLVIPENLETPGVVILMSRQEYYWELQEHLQKRNLKLM